MIGKIKKKVTDHKRLISNLSYLTILQVFNMLLPLITYPYLIRVLGSEQYGLVLYAQSIILFVTVFINFGFNISATRRISLNRDNKKRLGDVVNSVLIIKVTLFLLSFIGLAIASVYVPLVHDNRMLFLWSLTLSLYETIFPVWYFQGIEQMRFITILTLISRLIFTALMFIFIHGKEDYLLIPAFTGIGAMLAGISGLVIMYRQLRQSFYFPSYKTIRFFFIDSVPIFITNVSSQINLRLGKVLVGTYIGVADVTMFDLMEKIVEALKTPVGLLGQAIYPKVVRDKSITFVKKIFTLTLGAYLILYILLFFTAPLIIHLLAKDELTGGTPLLRIFAIVLPFAVCRHFLGVQVLIPWGKSKAYSFVTTIVSVLYILTLIILSMTTSMTIEFFIWLNVAGEVIMTLLLFRMASRISFKSLKTN